MRDRKPFLLALWLLAAPATLGQEAKDPETAPGETADTSKLAVVYLANEGFLLRSGDRAVLIDAFVTEPYSVYSAVPPDVFQKMLAGEPPFEKVQLALASHVHRDHFQPQAAGEFLLRHRETLFASSPEVIETLRRDFERSDEIEDRLRVVWPEPGRTQTLEHAGLRVDFLRLSHGSGRFAEIQNLGHVIDLGGRKVLHVGDAEMRAAQFEPYGLAARDLDVALVPYWYYPRDAGRALVSRHFSAEHEIACHVDTAETENVVKSFRMEVPWVTVFERAMDSLEF